MKKKIFFLILMMTLFFSDPGSVWAENTTESPGPVASPVSLKERLKQKFELRKQNIEESKQQVQAKLTERVRNRVQTVAQNIITRLERRIDGLETYAARLEELAVKFETRGADVTETREKINEAKDYLNTARIDLGIVESQLDQLLESEDPRSDYKELKLAVQKVRDDLHAVRKALAEAVSLLKVQKGQLEGGENVD